MQHLTREQIRALIPHDGAMCLLDRVVAWDDAGIHCRSETHRDPDHPLRHEGRLAAVHLIEYGAQAAAVHAGLLAHGSGSARRSGGALAGLRDVVLTEARIDTVAAALDVRAWRELGGPQGMIYRFAVENSGAPLAGGRLTVMT